MKYLFVGGPLYPNRHGTRGHAGVPWSRWAPMEMPRLQVQVSDETARMLAEAAARLWPGHCNRAINRLARDGIKRYLRYSTNGTPRPRTQR